LDGKLYRNLGLLGFTIIGNVKPYLCTTPYDNNSNEVSIKLFIESEIKDCIIEDLLEAIENDLEEGHNCNPEKWVKEMWERGLL